MIIYKTDELVIYETRSDRPSDDWTGKAEHIIDERNPGNAMLIAKIKQCAPYCELVLDESGNIIDVTPAESPDEPDEPTPAPTVWDELAAAYQEGVNSIDE
jgi:hypothetical protein